MFGHASASAPIGWASVKRERLAGLTFTKSHLKYLRGKFVGVLIASEFSPKVENVARGVDEVRLRTFKLRNIK